MKRIFIICLCCLLAAALFTGCKKTETPAPEEEKPVEAVEEAKPAAPTETTDLVRLESIDYDEATAGLTLQLTKGTFTPSTTEIDTDYTITYGDTVKMPLSKDASIDFPMAEDLTKTVTITADELTEEFMAFVKEFDDKPLFLITQEGGAVKTLTYFYLP